MQSRDINFVFCSGSLVQCVTVMLWSYLFPSSPHTLCLRWSDSNWHNGSDPYRRSQLCTRTGWCVHCNRTCDCVGCCPCPLFWFPHYLPCRLYPGELKWRGWHRNWDCKCVATLIYSVTEPPISNVRITWYIILTFSGGLEELFMTEKPASLLVGNYDHNPLIDHNVACNFLDQMLPLFSHLPCISTACRLALLVIVATLD